MVLLSLEQNVEGYSLWCTTQTFFDMTTGGNNMAKENIFNEFHNEKNVFIAEPLKRAVQSWLVLEDVGNAEKATELHFDALEGMKLYMANVDTEFAKLYIVSSRNIWRVYIKRDTICPGEMYHM